MRAAVHWPPYGLIPCVVLERFDACPTIEAARVRVTKTQGPCLRGEVMTINAHNVVSRKRRSRQ